MSAILQLARPEIRSLKPYQHATWAPTLERLHANEMPWSPGERASPTGLNRYPEPQPRELIERLAQLYDVAPDNVLAGRGSDEGIDLLVRAFCRAGQDSILIGPPTFGMYQVSASIQGAGVISVPLDKDRGFALDVNAVLAAWHENVKLVFVCSPNNPTGNLVPRTDIETLCERLAGKALVVVDEAYIEFANTDSMSRELSRFENLVVLRTLSKAYALAGARCGAVLAHADIIELLSRVITPYALPIQTITHVLEFTDAANRQEVARRIEQILEQRDWLSVQLNALRLISRVWRSDANFLLVDCTDADAVLQAAIDAGLIIRDPRSQPGLGASLRISIGTPQQNQRLVAGIEQAGAPR